MLFIGSKTKGTLLLLLHVLSYNLLLYYTQEIHVGFTTKQFLVNIPAVFLISLIEFCCHEPRKLGVVCAVLFHDYILCDYFTTRYHGIG